MPFVSIVLLGFFPIYVMYCHHLDREKKREHSINVVFFLEGHFNVYYIEEVF
jgi:hypothetical protein